MAEWIETFKGAVLAYEYDSQSHMNSNLYVTRFDQATWFLLASIGVTPRSMKQAGRRVAIVARVAETHGGRVRVEDAPGGGARFVLELPPAAGTVPAQAPSEAGRPIEEPQVLA